MIQTLGHSTLSPQEFLTAARGAHVIVDVRSHPGSRHVPQFNRKEMERWVPKLSEGKMRYEWWPSLGGWASWHTRNAALVRRMATVGVDLEAYAEGFPKSRIAAKLSTPPPTPSDSRATGGEGPKPSWTVAGFYDYAWFMTLDEFLEGADHLIERFTQYDHSSQHCALVCSEALYFKCHRSMIADYLYFRNIPCFHLPTKPPAHPAKPRWKLHADVIGNRLERYPPEVIEAWANH